MAPSRGFLALGPPGGPPGGDTVVFIEGDQIEDDDTKDSLGLERWHPQSHLTTMRQLFPTASLVVCVLPTTVAPGGQSCFGAFLPAMTATGEPLGFKPAGYKAATHLAELLAEAKAEAVAARTAEAGAAPAPDEPSRAGAGAGAEAAAQAGDPAPAPVGEGEGEGGVVLVGFSKGAVVVNQLLAEMAAHEEARGAEAGTSGGVVGAGPSGAAPPSLTGGAGPGAVGPAVARPLATALAGARPALAPPAAAAVLDSIRAVHFLDAGLNCRGVHLTDPTPISHLAARHRRQPLSLVLHGTPRQWGDRRRPWIAAEKDRFLALLAEAGLPAEARSYFAGQPGSLKQHFDVIKEMRP
ncbi:hypothetical protein HYH03_002230 [Edaphochlamys debaryana]|uniref:Uncharacterized protein n=1 Tax=Edaphochlamys debaryana TaxID=47281 RepID=A0A835YEW1_9CHLO|nr:hypothetical protein HYH03_002230 [Edaphochlamys debaryana]|eukprot:KAG2499943.1 hypothetical protein HYH03_002230 [Edaphochlamys debaryana]